MFYVYKLTSGDIEYIGHSKQPETRYKQHLYNIDSNTPGKFYNAVKWQEKPSIEILAAFKTKPDAKRFEVYLILRKYFNGETLYQRIPNISDR